jgi:pimeloyl-ACP methyl ester carboxylesterase
MSTISSKTILFIPGAFVSHHCWDEWISFFQDKGFTTHAMPWLYKDAPAQVLRQRHPDSEVASIRLSQLVDHYEKLARSLPEKPIIIGHSIGGLVAQLLMQRDVAAATVAIHSVPPQGIFTFKLSFLVAGWGPLGFFTNVNKTFMISFNQWKYAFTNGLSPEVQQKGYELAIPESKQIVRDTITSAAKVDFKKAHQPLLFLAGSADHTIPASLNFSNYKKYADKNSVTEYKLFEGRTHFVLNQPGWKENTSYILDWLKKI